MKKEQYQAAHMLGYDVIQAEQSHAEVSFIQFLRN